MPDAPSRVFEANARLHVGVLCVAALLHVHHGRLASEIDARVASTFHLVVTLGMALGRLWIWRTGQCRAYHPACVTGWCCVIVTCYVGAVLHEVPTAHFRIVQSEPCAACSFLLCCLISGTLHASVGPSGRQSAICLAAVALTCPVVVLSEPRAATVLFAVGCLAAHVLGYVLSAEIFAQQVRIVRFEDTIERQSCKQERTDYDLALSLKDAKKARRALDEVRSVVHAFEKASAPKPIRRVRRATPVVMGKPLFVLADGAIQLEKLRAEATTTRKLDEVEALKKEIDHQLRGYDTDDDDDHETPDEQLQLQLQLPHVLQRVKAAAVPLSVAGSLSHTTDDSPVVTPRFGSYEEADKE